MGRLQPGGAFFFGPPAGRLAVRDAPPDRVANIWLRCAR